MQINLDLKTVATAIALAFTLSASVGGYYVMKSDVQTLKQQVEDQEKKIHELQIKSTIDGTTLENVEKVVGEIKDDVKELLKK